MATLGTNNCTFSCFFVFFHLFGFYPASCFFSVASSGFTPPLHEGNARGQDSCAKNKEWSAALPPQRYEQ